MPRMFRLPLLFCVLAAIAAGCATGPAVLGSEDIPVRRVALYRNGVAYFERAGTFEGQELTFGVRQSEVGDFLSTLTAIERTAGGVQSVSFEAPEVEEPEEPPPPQPYETGECCRPIVPPTPAPTP